MPARERIRLDDESTVGNYFADSSNSPLDFISSGCSVLDCTLGGGWPLTRIANIIGDESTGKTLLAIEACANFHAKYPKGEMFYRETEAAFDEPYAEALGMPVDKVQFIEPDEIVTVEDFYEDLKQCAARIAKREVPGIYILDSLDALSSKDEMERGFGEGTYGVEKAKNLTKLFRMLNTDVAKSSMLLIIVSQTRDRIGAGPFQKKKTRSGGRALDFYASQCLWLSHLNTISATRGGVKRATGIRIKARCEKNKISLPYRSCEFTISFGHGIDAIASGLDFLEEAKRLKEITNLKRSEYDASLLKMSDEEYWEETKRVDQAVRRIWKDVDERLLEGVRPKYRRS
jgi:recombination protein RecA